MLRRGVGLLLCLVVLAGCTANRSRRMTSDARGAYCSGGDVGVASWYGKDFHGSMLRRGVGLLLCLAVLAGCTANRSRRTTSDARGAYCSGGDVGVASWYGKDFHGRKTSSGEVYNMYGLSAAHRTLPFGTVLRITECQRGKSIHVTVNDRGPFIADREIDLSFGAAKAIGMVADGIAEVGIQMVESPSRGTGAVARSKRPTMTERDRSADFPAQPSRDGGASSYASPQVNGSGRFPDPKDRR